MPLWAQTALWRHYRLARRRCQSIDDYFGAPTEQYSGESASDDAAEISPHSRRFPSNCRTPLLPLADFP